MKFWDFPPPPRRGGEGGMCHTEKLALDSCSEPMKTLKFRISSKSDENKKNWHFAPPPYSREGGLYEKISFELVFRTLENHFVPNFIKMWWKQIFWDLAPPPNREWEGGGVSGSFVKIAFGFVFRTLKNPLDTNFIKMWLKQKFRDIAHPHPTPPPPPPGGWGGGVRKKYFQFRFQDTGKLFSPEFHQNLMKTKNSRFWAPDAVGGGLRGPQFEIF